MNSTKVSVSGSKAVHSVFITLSESQKEKAERLEYEIKNSHTSTEEEAENEDQYKVKKPNKMRTKRIESTHGKYCDKCGLNMYEECRCVCVMCDKLIYIDCNCDEYDDDDDKSYYKGDHDLCDRCDEILPNNCTCSESDEEEEDDDESLPEEKDEIKQFLEDTGMSKSYFDSFNSPSDEVRELKAKIYRLEYAVKDEKEEDDKKSIRIFLLEEELKSYKRNLGCLENRYKEAKEEIGDLIERCTDNSNKLREEREENKKLKSDIFTLKTTIEARDESIKTICEERSTLYDEIQQLKKKADEDFEEENKIFWNHKNKIERLTKELKTEEESHYNTVQAREKYLKELIEVRKEILNGKNYEKLFNGLKDESEAEIKKLIKERDDAMRTSISLKNRCVEKDKQLREKKSYCRDYEDNFFRLLQKYNKCEAALKKVQL